MNQKTIKWFFYTFVCLSILIITSIFSLSVGASGISLLDVFFAIINRSSSLQNTILFDIRLPRLLVGIAVGGALAISGVILQGMFRNPLVDPYTFGISGGAGAMVCICMALGLHRLFGVWIMPIFGFIGSMIVMLIVYYLSFKKGILRIHGMLLIGVMISFISSSFIMLTMALSKTEDLQGIVFWIMGSLQEPNTSLIYLSIAISIIGCVVSFLFVKDLNALSLGEEEAHHLGVDVEKTKTIFFILASILTGMCVSISGIIGFVGLFVPHVLRLLIGNDHRILLINSFFIGSSFLIFCDSIARVIIAPIELPVGVVTGIIGGSVFIYILNRRISR
ncbi:MAG: iron ABC transporter permease [Thermodesulfovibrionales bacterium]|nr:iron ABC transporter permease [Thermodesulfovibrionales bacterium]